MGYIKQMKQLTELHLDASKLTSAGIAEIAQMTQLEKLSVAGVAGFADEHLKMLAPLVNLKYLDLTGSYVSDNGLLYLQPFTELEVLKMAKMQGVRGAGLKELMMKHKGLPHILQLTMYDNPYLSIEAYEGISRMKTLVVLDVGAANCTNAAFLGAMPPLKNLETLSVHENDALSDPAMAALPKMKKLKGLYFQNNKYISDASVPMFIKAKSLESLTILNTLITPTGAEAQEQTQELQDQLQRQVALAAGGIRFAGGVRFAGIVRQTGRRGRLKRGADRPSRLRRSRP